MKFSINGAIAWREGAALEDNPFHPTRQQNQWAAWRKEWQNGERHFNGFRNMHPTAAGDSL